MILCIARDNYNPDRLQQLGSLFGIYKPYSVGAPQFSFSQYVEKSDACSVDKGEVEFAGTPAELWGADSCVEQDPD